MATVMLTLSAFEFNEDLFADSAIHDATRWQVDVLGGDFSAPAWDSGWDTVNKLTVTSADVLVEGTNYQARAQVRDDLYVTSDWSLPLPLSGQGWRVTFFANDDLTPLLGTADELGNVLIASFYTSPIFERAYMKWPTDISDTEVNFIEGRSVIGEMTVSILDVRTDPLDQATGILTSLLPDLPDARTLVEFYFDGAWRVVMNGSTRSIRLDEGELVTYDFGVRDLRERERNFELFTRNETFSVFPPGPVEPYGSLGVIIGGSSFFPSGPVYLVPAAEVHVGTLIASGASGARRSGYVQTNVKIGDLSVGTQTVGQAGLVGVAESSLGELGLYGYPSATVRWRPLFGGDEDWVYLRDMRSYSASPGDLFNGGDPPPAPAVSQGASLWQTIKNTLIDALNQQQLLDSPARVYMEGPDVDMPPVGVPFEFQVLSAVTTPDTPLFFEGSFGLLLKRIYDGDFSPQAPRVPYDEERMLELIDSTGIARLRKTKTEEDMRRWVEEHVYKVEGLAPTVNENGRVEPISYELPPDTGAGLDVIDDTVVEYPCSWEASLEQATQEVDFVYLREFIAGDPPSLQTREVRRIFRNTDVTAGKTVKFKPETVRSIGTVTGEASSGEPGSEVGTQIAVARAREALYRFPRLMPRATLRCRGSHAVTKALRLGVWRVLQLSWLPDPTTRVRGCNRLVQVLSMKPATDEDGFVLVQVIDGGPNLPPLGAGVTTVGPASLNAEGKVELAVDAVEAGASVRADYTLFPAIEPTPSINSVTGGWTMMGAPVSTAPSVITSSLVVPSGWKAAVRWRLEAPGRSPGAWNGPLEVTAELTPLIRSGSITINPNNGEVVLILRVNAYAGGVALQVDYHPASEFASFASFPELALIPAAENRIVLPDAFPLDSSVLMLATVWATPYETFVAGGVDGESGPARQFVGSLSGSGEFDLVDLAAATDSLAVARLIELADSAAATDSLIKT